MRDIEGKIALVTGASKPTGIGYAIALKLAGEGAAVIVADRVKQYVEYPGYPRTGTTEEMEALVAQIKKKGGRGLAVPVDVTDTASVNSLAQTVEKEFGSLDILCNNAGGSPGPNAVVFMEEKNFQATLDINLTGTFRMCKALIPLMVNPAIGGAGRSIINTSSRAGKVASPFMAGYCCAKAALNMLTKVLALELAGKGIRVNCICPGQIQTELGQWGWDMRAFASQKTKEQMMEDLQKTIPLGRVGTPQEVAEVVAFLASERAAYITGQAINVTGGQLMEL